LGELAGIFLGSAGGATLEADQATPSAIRTPIKQKAMLIKTRGLKKADLEVGFFFIRNFLYC